MKNLLGEGNESLEVNATEPKRHRRRQRPCALPHPSPYRRFLGMTRFACIASDARRLLERLSGMPPSALQVSREELNDKIAELNSAIDSVSAQLQTRDTETSSANLQN